MASIKPANTILNSNDKQHEIRNNDIESQKRNSSILKNHTKAIISKSQSIKRWDSASTRTQEKNRKILENLYIFNRSFTIDYQAHGLDHVEKF